MVIIDPFVCVLVAFEGFVLYAGGDYTLYPNIMLLVQVMACVMSGMFICVPSTLSALTRCGVQS